MHIKPTDDIHWRKSRTAARLLIGASRGRLTPKRIQMANQLGADPQVLNRLIKQALVLFHKRHPHAVCLD